MPSLNRLLRALLPQPVDVTPIWIMRRHLPEYRETRERAGDFMTLRTTPELACEVTLRKVSRGAPILVCVRSGTRLHAASLL